MVSVDTPLATLVAKATLPRPVVLMEFLNITSHPTAVIRAGRMAVSIVLAAT